jgi:hypothetical protein
MGFSTATILDNIDAKMEEEDRLREPRARTAFVKSKAAAEGAGEGEFESAEATGRWKLAEYESAKFAIQMESAQDIMSGLSENNYDPGQFKNAIKTDASDIKWVGLTLSEDQQLYVRAIKMFINGLLRRESGAAITDSEYDRYVRAYFPVMGEKPEGQKVAQEARQNALANMRRQASGAYKATKDERQKMRLEEDEEDPSAWTEEDERLLNELKEKYRKGKQK